MIDFKELKKAIKKIIPDDVDMEYNIEGEDHILTRNELIEKIKTHLEEIGE